MFIILIIIPHVCLKIKEITVTFNIMDSLFYRSVPSYKRNLAFMLHITMKSVYHHIIRTFCAANILIYILQFHLRNIYTSFEQHGSLS